MADDVLLSATGIRKHFGGLAALSDVSISVRRGEIFGLIGPNGAGKTTLFKMLTGQEQPDGGTITVGDTVEFAGSVMVISHDRWFLDRIATHILAAEGDSQWVFFDGNYQEYEADKKKRLGEEGAKPKRVRYKALT